MNANLAPGAPIKEVKEKKSWVGNLKRRNTETSNSGNIPPMERNLPQVAQHLEMVTPLKEEEVYLGLKGSRIKVCIIRCPLKRRTIKPKYRRNYNIKCGNIT